MAPYFSALGAYYPGAGSSCICKRSGEFCSRMIVSFDVHFLFCCPQELEKLNFREKEYSVILSLSSASKLKPTLILSVQKSSFPTRGVPGERETVSFQKFPWWRRITTCSNILWLNSSLGLHAQALSILYIWYALSMCYSRQDVIYIVISCDLI